MYFYFEGAAFQQFKGVMRQFVYSGANVGRFYQTKEGIVQVMKSVSEDIHTKLLIEIKKDNPISLLTDAYQVVYVISIFWFAVGNVFT